MEEKQEQVVQEVEQNVSETEVVAENADGTVAAPPDGKPKKQVYIRYGQIFRRF